jgi:hypothetical protein
VQEQQEFRYLWSWRQRVRISESEFEKLLTTRQSMRKSNAEDVDDVLIRIILNLTH